MKGYRTVFVNVLFTLVPIMELTEWRVLLPEEYLPYWMLFVATANIILRAITTTPIGRKN